MLVGYKIVASLKDSVQEHPDYESNTLFCKVLLDLD